MKKLIAVIAFLAASAAFAHDEGHGPKLTDQGKQGGVVSPVIDAKDASKGSKATLIYKAELVRSDDGTVRVYLYDKDMNSLDLAKFGTAKGVVEFKKNKKWSKEEFTLAPSEGALVGKAPKVNTKPFNIDMRVKEGSKELLAAFDNLD
jgi:hypothetical protein